MDDKSFHIRVPKRWASVAMIVLVTAMIVAPLTALASHTFTDVSNSNTFHTDIDWLAGAGITKGCNPPTNDEYCPNDPVTRGQMSAFMRRLAQYIGAEDGTPAEADHAALADNADTVDGAHAGDLRTTLNGVNLFGDQGGFPTIALPTGSDIGILNRTLSPGGGAYAFVSYGVFVRDDTGSNNRVVAWLNVNGSCDVFQSQEGTLVAETTLPLEYGTLAGGVVVPVSGATTVRLCARAVSGNAHAYDGHLTIVQTDTGSADVMAQATSQADIAAAVQKDN